ncbi:hypothetical protein [Alkaliphilus sp. B6464]|uniref:hypothetical protein n=1 Tax=Alkaliphilus sp. B6464 TaxID=2731219 RepID=UPI001BABB3D1|nr:hypothetical protein [Alkaliphilus sp. B6464]QUH21772.1 hypothetical protein HYG84_17705 [Alkaliphilus sp. B6464]
MFKKIFMGMIIGIVSGWLLTFLGVEQILVGGVFNIIDPNIGIYFYYILFCIIGIIISPK